MKKYINGNYVEMTAEEIAEIKSGFFMVPAPLSEPKWNLEAKTLSYIMNTDIDMEKSEAVFANFDKLTPRIFGIGRCIWLGAYPCKYGRAHRGCAWRWLGVVWLIGNRWYYQHHHEGAVAQLW